MFLGQKTSQNAVSTCKMHWNFVIWFQKWRRSEMIRGPGKRYGSDRSHQFFKPLAGIDLRHSFEFRLSERYFGTVCIVFLAFQTVFRAVTPPKPHIFAPKIYRTSTPPIVHLYPKERDFYSFGKFLQPDLCFQNSISNGK